MVVTLFWLARHEKGGVESSMEMEEEEMQNMYSSWHLSREGTTIPT
jgi:hypothetical protein